ncbi:flagellar motor protein MotP [Syntrophotalea acetylenivorans]|uniref:Flagellar motor protein MotP n=1 Tax=Syntrophotalea acetylenivorans TaxID=1842532 RepID=A0A1L3GN17_9BACT|nr:motility protein A [Syntrophotalea acetylenivorans]APG27324.1 flagellar motor protein MotP [Syntrophotalea acetylenivorans]
MDLSTIVGIVAAFGLMVMAIVQGGSIMLFVNTPSLIIVIGGTIGATLVNYPFSDVMSTLSVIKKAFKTQKASSSSRIEQLIRFAGKARKEGVLSLQSVISEVNDPFFIKGLQMAVDGQEPDNLKEMLDREIEYIEERHGKGANILLAVGGIAPAMGMIGTLIGLVQMLQTMNDPSSIGPAMAVALLTTFYGAVIANVLCMPLAGKLKNRSADEILDKTLVAEGMKSILEGENPRIIEQKLHAFVAPKERQSNFGKKG